jgi:hypothetical protein
MLGGLSQRGLDPAVVDQVDQLQETTEQGRGEEVEAGVMAHRLAERLLARSQEEEPGHLLVNPCNFTRQVAVELAGVKTPLPAPARATQIEGDWARVVVDVPALGFAWLPLAVGPGTLVAMPKSSLVVAERTLQNEHFVAEVDPESGGLRIFRGSRDRHNRIGQQLVYGPGSLMHARTIRVTAAGPALGEIVSEGVLLDGHGGELAIFRQRFRCWRSRPLLELRMEMEPVQTPTGYPWHAYYGVRLAWRDERARIFRGVNLMSHPTTHTRPESPDYLEIRSGSARTTLLTGGLPFHQRHSQRMLDVILVPEGETAHAFDLALGADLEEPAQAALDFITPTLAVGVTKGPPHVGKAGWLFHLNASHLVLTSLRPAAGGVDAVIARILECRSLATQAELRCPRDPARAFLIDEFDEPQYELPVVGDAVSLNFAAGEMQRVRIDFS